MKNLIIAAIVGLAFMAGGFWYGMRLKPLPTPQAKAVQTAAAGAQKPPTPDPISLDTLKKTSETMMSLNDALAAREKAVAEREAKVQQREDELSAERTALDASHERFKGLFAEFQQRLQLVTSNQTDELQKQADLYVAMGSVQSIDIIRAKEDTDMCKLFSIMDTKPLAKLITDWKTKYPEDAPRLLHVLDAMATVMPKDKIALVDPPPVNDSGSTDSAPASSTPAPADSSTPAAPPAPADSSAPSASPAPSDSSTPPVNSASAPDAATPSASATPPSGDVPVAPSADPNGPAPVALPVNPSTEPAAPTSPENPSSPPPLAPPPDKHSGTVTAAAGW